MYTISIPLILTDINECDANNGGCSHNCTNTEGSFECSCRVGYILDNDGKGCSGTFQSDVYTGTVSIILITDNECDANNGGCSHNCINTEGSLECSCRVGYTLDSDGKNCSGINVPK